jgi:hypothetical protein
LLAKVSIPLALLFILSACGGGTAPKPVSTRVLHGPGFSFSVPGGWKTSRSDRAAAARSGKALVSATTFPLLKPYRPALFPAATKELDGVARKLAAQAGQSLTEQQTTTVDGKRIRAYRFGTTRIGFVLDGKREFQLLCRLPPGGEDADGACGLLFSTFSVL